MHRARARDGGRYRSRSPLRRKDDREKDNYRSRKDSPSPGGRPARQDIALDYDDDGRRDERGGRSYEDDRWGGAGRYNGRDNRNGRHKDYRNDSHRQYDMEYAEPPGARPSRIVQVGELPDDATERDVLYGLDRVEGDPNLSSDQVKVVRIRTDRRGRRCALVEFNRAADAEKFVKKHSPTISFALENSRGAESEPIRFDVDIADGRDDTEPRDCNRDDLYDDGWTCRECGGTNYPGRYVCYKCRTERYRDDDSGGRDFDHHSANILTGETDEDPQQAPSHYMVIRNLERSVTEEVLASGVSKLILEQKQSGQESSTPAKLKSTAPGTNTAGLGAKPGSLRRVFLMRDRRTDQSWRYGFAEFATIEDARGAVAKYKASAKFTISSRPVVIAFVHSGVFIPSLDQRPSRPGDDREFSFTPINNPSIKLQYWDDRAYPSCLVVSSDPLPSAGSPEATTGPESVASAAKPSGMKSFGFKKAKKEKETGGKGIAMAPQIQMWARKAAELHKGAPNSQVIEIKTASTVEAPNPVISSLDAQPDAPRVSLWNDQYFSYADWDKFMCLVCDREAPPDQLFASLNLGHYTREQWLIDHEIQAHNHFRDEHVRKLASEKLTALKREPKIITRRNPRLQSQAPKKFKSYADRDTLICHLCSRKFKHHNTLLLHEQESELHRRMLANPRNAERATVELKAVGKEPVLMVPKKQPQYRDRALERRVAFNQPTKPNPNSNPKTGEKRKDNPAAAASTPEEPVKKSKGAGILAKMGWTAGVGLGAEGAGRTEAIATDAYVPGVGLGAEGGKLGDAGEEAQRNTRGNFSDFVEKTRDKARERYDKLS